MAKEIVSGGKIEFMSYMFRMITEECYECRNGFMSVMIDYSCEQCSGVTATETILILQEILSEKNR